MSIVVSNKKTAMSLRKDENIGKISQIGIKPSLLVNIPPQIKGFPSFNADGTLITDNIYDLAKRLATNWFPPDNFTPRALPAGNLVVNGSELGKLDIAVIPGQTINNVSENALINNTLFSQTKDIASAWIIVKGNLNLANVTLQPSQRKLFTVIYVTGDLTFDEGTATISMTQRGANHSGTGDSGGYTAPASIKVGPNTFIDANGAGGASENSTSFTAQIGQNGSTEQQSLQSGGGGGGWNDYSEYGGGGGGYGGYGGYY
jgi:hypothetical protein